MPPKFCSYCPSEKRKAFLDQSSLAVHLRSCPAKKQKLEASQKAARESEERARREQREAEEQAEQQRLFDEAAAQLPPPPPLPPPLPRLDGRPRRKVVRPKRWLEAFPEPPPPAPEPEPQPEPEQAPDVPAPRRWRITNPNSFGVYKVYACQPSHDPDRKLQKDISHLCETAEFVEAAPEIDLEWWKPFQNPTHALVMQYELLTRKESIAGSNSLLNMMRDPNGDFKQVEIGDFTIEKGNAILDAIVDTLPGKPKNGWSRGQITLQVPPGRRSQSALLEITVDEIFYRPILEIVREAFSGSMFERLHTTPFSLRCDPTYIRGRPDPYSKLDLELDECGLPALPEGHHELHGEMYTASRTLKAYNRLPECAEEPVIVSLMPYSDGTHLAQFGTASLQPGYLFLGNQSKYERAKPSANAVFHMVYFPTLPTNIKEKFQEHYGHRMPDDVLTNLKRDLFHAVWALLIDDEFVDTYINGFAHECLDKAIRRLFPRLPAYMMDYPEKVLAATMKFLARRPCPRCLILKVDIPLTGTKNDLKRRQAIREDTLHWRNSVVRARRKIFEKGYAINSDVVTDILGDKSYVPVKNAFAKLSDAGADFNLFEMFVPDLLHEIELGVVKALFTHLIRMLYALDKSKVVEFDARFRLVPTFGRMTIRRFHQSISEMKKMAARDFEDILQCLGPVAEDLFEQYDALVQKLIIELQVWHAYAKLRQHTTASLVRFRKITVELCATIRKFARETADLETCETPQEQGRRKRRDAAKAAQQAADGDVPVAEATESGPRARPLNLETYKYHTLPDYPEWIPLIGTTDSTSTQVGELAHRFLKYLYGRTNRRNFVKQIAVHERRVRMMREILQRRKRVALLAEKRSLSTDDENAEPPAKKSKDSRRAAFKRGFGLAPRPLQRYSSAAKHHDISHSTRKFWHIDQIPGAGDGDSESDDSDAVEGDPAIRNLLIDCRTFLRARLEKKNVADVDYTPQELLEVNFERNRIHLHATMRLNHATYDLKRDQDMISPRTRPNIMFLSSDPDDTHPYCYAQTIAICHARVKLPTMPSFKTLEFLFTRSYQRDQRHRCLPDTLGHPRLEFMHHLDDGAFAFVDPTDVVRGAHIIPAFAHGRTKDLLPPSIVRPKSENDEDWRYYYANSVVDRDMFMRYQRDAIGHRHIWAGAMHSLGVEEEWVDEEMDVDEELDTEEAAAGRLAAANDREDVEQQELDELEDEEDEQQGEGEGDGAPMENGDVQLVDESYRREFVPKAHGLRLKNGGRRVSRPSPLDSVPPPSNDPDPLPPLPPSLMPPNAPHAAPPAHVEPQAEPRPFSLLTARQQFVVNDIRLGLKLKALDKDGRPKASARADDDGDASDSDGEAQRPKKRRKTDSIYNPNKNPYTLLTLSGQYFMRAIHSFRSFETVADHGATQKWGEDEVTIAAFVGEREEDIAIHTILVSLFDTWLTYVLKLNHSFHLEDVLRFLFVHQPKVWSKLTQKIHKRGQGRRQTETHDLKFELVLFLPNPTTDTIIPHLNKTKAKDDRGVKHPLTRAYLLGLEDRSTLPKLRFKSSDAETNPSEEAERLITNLAKGIKKLKNKHWPSFLYENADVFDPKKTHIGLFRGFLLIRILRFLWLGPDLALTGLTSDQGLPPQSPSRAHRVDKLTPPMIAYAACQARTMLQVLDWAEHDGKFDHAKFFNGIVKLFAAPTLEKWAEETLKALNDAVFNSNELGSPDDDSSDDDAADDLIAQFTEDE
uniref:Uncharacterized protein n=1 Tax=Mycena chlorophos TaxID=658473 RepID=A0ABQ0KXZ0_MYCCL|nr:predicted protein [Mycena chlorophos]